MNYGWGWALRRLDPACCEQIAANYRKWRRPLREEWTVGDRICEAAEIASILQASLAQDYPRPVSQIALELGYESANRLRRYFPDLCRAIAAKAAANRKIRHERLRNGLLAALKEEPPPPAHNLGRRLTTCATELKRLFPNLYGLLQDCRRQWRIRRLDRLRRELERLIEDRKGASVPVVCRAAGIGQLTLLAQFPDLYRTITSNYVQQRDAVRAQRREALRDEVRRIVSELIVKGIHPRPDRIWNLLSKRGTRDWWLVSQTVKDAMREAER